ncbi:VPLPA-CTERM sorting domain-containing protein [Defluviimonas aestuarii]|uniref:VPLPA-CTERM sorting domain-containing protein n=1 Tax=Albidovulum aestuarii TaxID=1130726 RepID=UPI00249CE446|nr:VPLPA-CTERM sorting domain-containing protein [Defluviimonas aestuarii]MDI3338673.1 VPLPA-CTERM sorting domain-containing protein [Defluviimonas aestuarii]
MNWCTSALAGLALMVGASAADANVIDFTNAGTGTSGTILNGSVSWTMDASGYLNNTQAFDGNSAPSGSGLSFQTDGYGVGMHDDEITTVNSNEFEWIRVTFSAPVMVNAIYFLDLFQASDGSSQEIGVASINGGYPIISLYANDIAGSGAAGFVGASFAAIAVTEIFFTVLSSNDNLGFADGALAGIGFVAPVPLPAAGLLLLGGLGGLAAVRRRRKAA